MKVLYIAGTGRNGSTLLGNILGSLPGFVHVGELMYLWDRGVIENWECGCGAPFKDCTFWQNVMQETGISNTVAHDMLILRERGVRSHHLLLHRAVRESKLDGMHRYLDQLSNVYFAVSENTGCQWIIDSSKFPSHAYLLSRIANLDVRILHLVRDPRAVAFSWWRRPKRLGYGVKTRRMPRITPIRSATIWLIWNYTIQYHWGTSSRYFFLKYEDFVKYPATMLGDVLNWLEIPRDLLGSIFVDERTIRVLRQHTVSGNPVRFSEGEITISTFSFSLSPLWKVIVSVVTAPLLVKYGYPL